MPTTVRLMDGAIEMVNELQEPDQKLKPVLQVLDLRMVNPTNTTSERYMIILSDGVHKQPAILALQLIDLVRSQKLQNGSIIRLTEFTCTDVQKRRIIICIDLDVILEKCEAIGEPVPYQRVTDDDAAPVIRSSPLVHPMNQPGIVGTGAQSLTAGPIISGPVISGSSPRRNFSVVNHMLPLQILHQNFLEKFYLEKMPTTVKLMEGAIEILNENPVLQVLDLRLMNLSNSTYERYRLVLSDGLHKQHALLATQSNNLVRSQKLQKGSIIRLTEFTCSSIQNRRIITCHGLDVILEKCEPIGEPVLFQRKTDDDAAPIQDHLL